MVHIGTIYIEFYFHNITVSDYENVDEYLSHNLEFVHPMRQRRILRGSLLEFAVINSSRVIGLLILDSYSIHLHICLSVYHSMVSCTQERAIIVIGTCVSEEGVRG